MTDLQNVFQIVLISAGILGAICTPHGAPSSSCKGDMAPVHENVTQSSDPAPCKITAAWSNVLENVVEITIEATANQSFKGYLLVAYMTGMNEHFVGKFIGTTNGHLLNCDGYHANSAVTHANGESKTKVKIFWVPGDYRGSVSFRATIVGNDVKYYWPNVMSNTVSVAKSSSAENEYANELLRNNVIQDGISV